MFSAKTMITLPLQVIANIYSRKSHSFRQIKRKKDKWNEKRTAAATTTHTHKNERTQKESRSPQMNVRLLNIFYHYMCAYLKKKEEKRRKNNTD